ncbi:MAG: HAMP domain-containing protein [Anaerolineae bacterium]|nr:HAMP domain-containing protein [Anaerolineae bacterium]
MEVALLIEQDWTVVVAAAYRQAATMAGVVGVAAVLAAAAALLLTRRIVRPITELTAVASDIAAGNLERVAPLQRADEMGLLAHAFNEMTRQLRNLVATLEQRVAERTQALQEANAELEAFAYSVSHDLRAPLRATQGLSQALLEDCGDQLDAVGRDYVLRIQGSAQRMDTLIQDLLAYSRIARANVEFKVVSLELVLQDVLLQLESAIREQDARVTVEKPLPAVVGHYPTLAQVVANLVANAIKFVAPDVQPRVRIWAEKRDGVVRLWVEDNGIGIAPEHYERIFCVFERLHGIETYPGTGIGLAIVRKGMQRMGGAVGLDSTVGEGSDFWIELPVGDENARR